jgi:hypothetical protein
MTERWSYMVQSQGVYLRFGKNLRVRFDTDSPKGWGCTISYRAGTTTGVEIRRTGTTMFNALQYALADYKDKKARGVARRVLERAQNAVTEIGWSTLSAEWAQLQEKKRHLLRVLNGSKGSVEFSANGKIARIGLDEDESGGVKLALRAAGADTPHLEAVYKDLDPVAFLLATEGF